VGVCLLYAVATLYLVALVLPLFTETSGFFERVPLLPRLVEEGGRRAGPSRDPLPAPPPAPAAALERFRPLPAYRDAVPVLVYHGIGNDRDDPYSVTQRAFDGQMAMLRRAGFRTISSRQYARFLGGDARGLPSRPILVTFDDGRLDSYRGADAVLARYRFQATMFVISGHAEDAHPFYLNWNELRAMQRSGRWNLQLHSGRGHVAVPYDARGDRGPYYAFRIWRDGALESFAAYRRRVTHDIEWGLQILRQRVPGIEPFTFAVPFGNYGQLRNNDPRIPRFFNRFLRGRFGAVFVQNEIGFTTRRTPRGQVGRYEVGARTRTDQLYRWLRSHIPRRR
jgi:poly-beta-1,6-N-acetyl-D-glucosamine N-deacetylase